jgi:tetratricopeptide (TPR) repeat protein
MRHPGEEQALLVALAETLAPYEMTVTFNGRTFDLPLLRTRYGLNRRRLPAAAQGLALLGEDRPHLDLLHPARRLWRRRLQSCRLINLEQMILGLQRSEDDVPGHLIPSLYLDYMRTGNAGEMRRVFYHNCEDIVSMVALAEQLGRAYGEDQTAPAQPLDGLDVAALGRVYQSAGRLDQAEHAYRRALAQVRSATDRADLFARLGRLLKQQGRWQEAADTWQLWLTSVPGGDPTPYVEMAKYCEWQLNDLEQAEMWTAWALHTLQSASTAHGFPGARVELEYRLARLRRRQASREAEDESGTAPTQP